MRRAVGGVSLISSLGCISGLTMLVLFKNIIDVIREYNDIDPVLMALGSLLFAVVVVAVLFGAAAGVGGIIFTVWDIQALCGKFNYKRMFWSNIFKMFIELNLYGLVRKIFVTKVTLIILILSNCIVLMMLSKIRKSEE